MFALRGKKLIEVVLQHIPEDIERLMQKRHTKWCDDARLVPWSRGEGGGEIGATLRVSPRFSQETYALSWGAALNASSTVEIFLYEGDVAHLIYRAASGTEERDAAKREIQHLAYNKTKCKDVKDLVSKIIQKIQDAVVAHKMLEGV
jgi:hypothetical protein